MSMVAPGAWHLRSFAAAVIALVTIVIVLARGGHGAERAPNNPPNLAVELFKELIEINTVVDSGDTARAADAMAARLRAAGFTGADLQVFKPAPRKGNLVARLRGRGLRKPILLLAHLDVVAARESDWSLPPFKFIEKDGFYYGRGSSDDKYMAAHLVNNLIRYRNEGFVPDRDIVVVLETDEENGDQHGVGIRWLLKHRRALLDAEFALNEGGGVVLRQGKPQRVNLAVDEKYTLNIQLQVSDSGGHSALPLPDNAIVRLADGLGRLARHSFPVVLTPLMRQSLEKELALEAEPMARDMKALLDGRSDPALLARLTARTDLNARLRTTCVPTLLEGGHATNALPQMARATVNCRLLPGESSQQVRSAIVAALADKRIEVSQVAMQPQQPSSKLIPEVLAAIEHTAAEFWPGVPVVPVVTAGSTDGRFLRAAGIPTYGHTGLASGESRAHGKDERVSVKAFNDGGEYLYRLVKRLAGGT